MSTVEIKIDGVDITDDVFIKEASFTSLVNGQPGPAAFKVKDVTQSYDFISGGSLTLDIDGERKWGGYVMRAIKSYLLIQDTTDPGSLTRVWSIAGADYNILFNKRVVYQLDDPSNKVSWEYDADTYDDTIINDIFDNYLEIADDDLTRTGVQRIAKAILDVPGKVHSGSVASAGYTWKQVMDRIARETGGVYYINPSKDLFYVDVEDATSTYSLTDTPSGGSDIGYQSFSLMDDGTKMVNDMFVWGSALGSDHMVFSRTTDSSSVSAHGIHQLAFQSGGLYRQASADIVADSYVYGTPASHRGGKDPNVTLSCRVFEPVFECGQTVDTTVDIYGYNDVLPLRRMTITFANPTEPIFDLTLGHEIDEPVGIWEYKDAVPIGGLGGHDPLDPGPIDHPPHDQPECDDNAMAVAGCASIDDEFNRIMSPAEPIYGGDWPIDSTTKGWGQTDTPGFYWYGSSLGAAGNKVRMAVSGGDASMLLDEAGIIDASNLRADCTATMVDANGDVSGVLGDEWLIKFSFENISLSPIFTYAVFGMNINDFFFTVNPQNGVTTINNISNISPGDPDDLGLLSGPVSDGQVFWLKSTISPGRTTVDVRFWADGDPEPSAPSASGSALGDLAAIAPYVSFGQIQTGVGLVTELSDWVDYDTTIHVHEVHVYNHCAVFEDFERISASDWSYATPSGAQWLAVGPGTATRSVGGGLGKFRQNDPGTVPNQHGSVYNYTSDRSDIWGGDFDLIAQFALVEYPDPAFSGDLASWGLSLSSSTPISGSFDQGLYMIKRDSGHSNADTLTFVPASGSSATVVLGFTLAEGGTYNVRWLKAMPTIKVKVWPLGTTEPSAWDIDTTDSGSITPLAFFVYQQQPFTRIFSGGSESDLEIDWAFIDFGYDGRPCYVDCGHPTTVIATFDNFNRTDNSSPPQMGTTPSGYVWHSFGSPIGTLSYEGLDGSHWFQEMGHNFNNTAPGKDDGTDLWAPPIWSMRVRFRCTVAPSSSARAQLIVGPYATGLVVQFDERTYNSGTVVGGAILIGGGAYSVPGTSGTYYAKNNWSANVWYIAELLWDSVNGHKKARVYVDGSTPPAWQIDVSTSVPRIGVPGHLSDFGFLLDTDGAGPGEFQVDNIEFETDVCTEIMPTPGLPNTGDTCETIVHSVTSADFATSKAFFSGSLDVWVNGIRQTDFTFSAPLGQFTLSDTIEPEDWLRVCYRSNGDPI